MARLEQEKDVAFVDFVDVGSGADGLLSAVFFCGVQSPFQHLPPSNQSRLPLDFIFQEELRIAVRRRLKFRRIPARTRERPDSVSSCRITLQGHPPLPWNASAVRSDLSSDIYTKTAASAGPKAPS